MDEDLFKDRLSKALKAEVPPDANRGTWIGRRADELDITEDRLGCYVHAENVCPGWILLKLFDKFGPIFEARVRGHDLHPSDNLAQEIQEVLDRHVGNGGLRAVSSQGKIS